ncbi:MAG: hypothetical protein ACTSQO_00765 [Candidatus Helarchaeota archaeon]
MERYSSEHTTLGSVLAYLTHSGTSITPAILIPHRHTNTPILGSSVSSVFRPLFAAFSA